MTIIAQPNTWRYQEFTGNGSFVVPPNIYRMLALVIGPGGGGGGGGNGSGSKGGGGGAGEAKQLWIDAVPGETLTVTVPAGGAGGATNTSGSAGTSAADTTLSRSGLALVSAEGGKAGAGGSSDNGTAGSGGAGGGYRAPAGGIGAASSVVNPGSDTTEFMILDGQQWVANGPSGASSDSGAIGGGRSRFFAGGRLGDGAGGQWPGPAGATGAGPTGKGAGYGGGGHGGAGGSGVRTAGSSGQGGYIRLMWQV